jgi:MoxR-like ATPase
MTNETNSTYLSAQELESLNIVQGNLMWRSADGLQQPVESICAFPLSYPEKEIVLQGNDKTELGIIEDLATLKKEIRQAILDQLEKRYFLPQVTMIHKMTERFGSAIWDLETDRGRIAISTRQLNEAVRELGPRRFLIVDVDGNRYEIKELNDLPPESQAHFIGR